KKLVLLRQMLTNTFRVKLNELWRLMLLKQEVVVPSGQIQNGQWGWRVVVKPIQQSNCKVVTISKECSSFNAVAIYLVKVLLHWMQGCVLVMFTIPTRQGETGRESYPGRWLVLV